MDKNILITGGAGFIGTHVVKHFVHKYPDYAIYNLDSLTYAGNLENLKSLKGKDNYKFLKGDICDISFIKQVFKSYQIDSVIHLAAESHVDRSIESAKEFINTNIIGTYNLLDVSTKYWNELKTDKKSSFRFLQT